MVETIYKTPEGQRQVMAMYDAVLADWPGKYETRRVPTRHGDTFVIASGSPAAPALVLLHGSSSNALAWVEDVPVYSPHFRVYAVDIPGEPGRSAHNRPAWDGPEFSEWLEDVLDGLGVQRAALLAASQGGWPAMKFATTCPERVEKLVLLAPVGVVPPRTSFIVSALFFSMFGRWGVERINRIIFGGPDGAQPDTARLDAARRFMAVILNNFKARMGPRKVFSDGDLARLQMPVLLVIGEKDGLIPTDRAAARLQALLPKLTVHRLPQAGHVLNNRGAEILPFLVE